ncbi:uncharacterized protein LOC128033774 [Gossypium raimondii]|uniref:uncharacterized protein LOC128033774 n=1 Tax=Gossypium raimondii TaxID=29730 RepID=UPI002279FD67|nr:uncharacterized protein LOC128033774 [Gossypium raimondii]
MDSMESPGFEVEQNTLGGYFGGEAFDSDDSSYKAYESGTAYSDSFESDGDRVDEPEVELVGEMIQKELDHLLGSSFWSLEDDFDSNSDDYLNNDVDYDKYGNKKYPLFNPQTDMKNPILINGLVFPSRDILKDAIKQYGRINRVETKLTRNDKLRVKAVCVPSCPWTLWASKLNPKDPMDRSWQIKTLVNHHKCGKVMKNKNITSKWMARHYLHKFQVDPNYSLTSLQNDIRVDFGTIVSQTKCMRAKIRALKLVQGNHKAQYANIYDYLLELRRSNPGTTTICKLDYRLFQRLYICLEACKSGWLTGCRRIIGLDGCWLKGYYGGHLLAAVGVDANDCIYPVAFVAVESENKQSWFWFLKLLQRDLEIDNSYNICFMFDKQKGLIEAISLLFPNAEARNCARHLYNNFKNMEGFRGHVLRLTYWKVAKATFPRQFEEAMSEMRSLSESVEAWLCDKDPRTWSRAHFSTRCKSDLLLNNNNECFNKIILEARDKPILTMLEIIRRKIMTRLVSMREAAEKYPGPLCPRIQKKLFEIVSQSNNIWPTYAGNEKYEVDCGLGNKHVVDLLNFSCSCRKWDLSGIPCKHAVSCMQLLLFQAWEGPSGPLMALILILVEQEHKVSKLFSCLHP